MPKIRPINFGIPEDVFGKRESYQVNVSLNTDISILVVSKIKIIKSK